jgi:short-subunit dehydrogenase
MVKVGTIYGLVNDAGFVEPGTVEDIPMHDVRISNLFGHEFHKKVLPFKLENNQGRIVNISSA